MIILENHKLDSAISLFHHLINLFWISLWKHAKSSENLMCLVIPNENHYMTDFEVYSKVHGMFLILNKALICKKYSTLEYQPRSLFTETSVIFQLAHLTNNREKLLNIYAH